MTVLLGGEDDVIGVHLSLYLAQKRLDHAKSSSL